MATTISISNNTYLVYEIVSGTNVYRGLKLIDRGNNI